LAPRTASSWSPSSRPTALPRFHRHPSQFRPPPRSWFGRRAEARPRDAHPEPNRPSASGWRGARIRPEAPPRPTERPISGQAPLTRRAAESATARCSPPMPSAQLSPLPCPSPWSLPSPPPLARVVTGLPGAPPEDPLGRVVTGAPAAVELPPAPWERLVRVVTGRAPAAALPPPGCEPLVRVVTGTLPAAGLGDAMCEPLDRVTSALRAPMLDPA
jgi:hypothetical protein